MIKLQDMTPEVYYRQSRDFQFIGRLFDVVLNSVKTNADLIYALPLSDNSDERLIDLMTLTLGFKPRHNYNVAQLTALCNSFCYVLRNKGSITAIETAANALLHSEGINEEAMCYFTLDEKTGEYDYKTINVFIPAALSDINLFKDILDYILPAGMSCNIVRTTSEDLDDAKTNIEISTGDRGFASITPVDGNETGKIPQLDKSPDDDAGYNIDSVDNIYANGVLRK